VYSFEDLKGDVLSLGFSPDGRFLAAGAFDTVSVWDVDTGQIVAVLPDHQGSVSALAISPNGHWVVAGTRGEHAAVSLWDIESRKLVRRFPSPARYSDVTRAVAFSPDGQTLAAVGLDRKIHIWKTEQTADDPSDAIFDPAATPQALAFSPDGHTLAYGTAEGRMVSFDLNAGKTLKAISGHKGGVLSLGFAADGVTLISVGEDNIIRRWNAESGHELEARHINGDIRLVALTSLGSHAVVASAREVSVYAVRNHGAIPPVVTIMAPFDQEEVSTPQVRLLAKAVDDQGLDEVVVALNGAPLMISGATVRDVQIVERKSDGEVLLDQDIRLNVGMNKITITATDTDGLSRSETVHVRYVPEQGEVWAVVIGISRYRNVSGLRYADADASAFYDYLVNYNHVPPSHISLLLNEDATLQRLKDVLGVELKQKARKQDMIIIFYAGHGAPEPDQSSLDGDGLEKYLLPHDADPRRLYSTALPMAEIAKILSRFSAERVLVLQDTCFSGSTGIGSRTIQNVAFRASISEAYLNRLAQAKGRVILAASEANEVSIERDDLGHGVFTYYLLEALRHGDVDGDGLMTASEVFRYLSEKVPEATGQNQHPVKRGVESREIIVGRVQSGP
jgi:WD40 repeat protein